jgi:predicted amidohydrolase
LLTFRFVIERGCDQLRWQCMTQSTVSNVPVRIAVAQTTAIADPDHNLRIARGMVSEAARGGARLLAFPEVFLFVGERQPKLAAALTLDGPVVGEFRELAARHGMLLLLGSIHERIGGDPERVHNTSVLLGDDGAILAHYRKLNLFGVDMPGVSVRESDTIAAGTAAPPVVDTAIGRLGLTICFDLRFPGLYQDLRARGAQIVFIPSNFTVPTGTAHWEVLLRARAIEGQYFVVAPAQVGQHNPHYSSYGHGMVVDPWGQVVMVNDGAAGVRFAELDLHLIDTARARLPLPSPGLLSEDSVTAC